MSLAEIAGPPVLILTPVGRDASLAASALAQAGVPSQVYATLPELTDCLDDNSGAVLLAKEALLEGDLEYFKARIAEQPPWSDIPLLVLTHSGSVEDAS